MNSDNNKTKIPKLPWKDHESPMFVMGLIRSSMEHGYTGRSDFRDAIGVYGLGWNKQNLGERNNWSMRSLAVLSCLDGSEKRENLPSLNYPPGLNFGPLNTPFDIQRLIVHIAHRWRYAAPTEDFWVFVNAVEVHFANTLSTLWPEMKNIEPLQRSCDILACIFKAEQIYCTPLQGPKLDCDPVPEEFARWISDRLVSSRRSVRETPEAQRICMSAAIFAGEEDAHARHENGVFAGKFRDILESQRPTVSTDALSDASRDMATDFACGIINFFVISTLIRKHCGFNWIDHNLFIDFTVPADMHFILERRNQPWIVLIANSYFIRYPNRQVTYRTTSSVQAIYMWFKLFWEDGEDEFFDGEHFRSMTTLPHTCPLSKEFFSGEEG
jgi:hypothetical protein